MNNKHSITDQKKHKLSNKWRVILFFKLNIDEGNTIIFAPKLEFNVKCTSHR